MKFIVSILLIAILSFTACMFFDWWSIAIVAFVVAALIPQSPGASFLSAFTSLFILWGSLSLWYSINNEHLLAQKVSFLILKMNNPFLLVMVTALIGALVAGLAALTASFLHRRRGRKPAY